MSFLGLLNPELASIMCFSNSSGFLSIFSMKPTLLIKLGTQIF